jgi:hypothetical protein
MSMKIRVALIIVLCTVFVFASYPGQIRAQQQPADPPAGGTLAQRVEQRKKERAIKLDDKDQKRLASQCVKTQSKLRAIQQRAAQVTDNRSKTYQHIDAELWIVTGQLKLAEKDTFKLEKKRSQLAERTAAFQSIGSKYRQALDDSVVINCQADAVGFKALLDTTRIYYKQWSNQAATIRTFIINDIKNTLTDHVKDLQTQGGNN